MMRVKVIATMLLFALLLVACGREVGSDPDPAPDDTTDDSADDAEQGDAAGAGSGCEVGETDGDLLLYNWSEYIDPDLITAFEDEFGIDVTEDFYPSNEELLARVQSGGADYDVIVPSDYMVSIMIEEGLLAPMDRDLVPNVENIDDAFADPPYDPGNAFSMPYQWGTTGLGVDLDVVGEDVEPSWGLIFDPEVASEFSGRIALLDDPRETMGAALYSLGYSANTTDEAEIQEAADLLSEATQNVAAFDSSQYADLLISGEVAISHGYSGTYFAAFAEADGNFAYIIPEEGATKWVDTMAVLASAPHPCTAYTFVNFLLEAENGAMLTNWNFYGSPNAAAEEFILEEILQDPAIYPPDDDGLTFLEDTGETEIIYNDLFTRAKS